MILQLDALQAASAPGQTKSSFTVQAIFIVDVPITYECIDPTPVGSGSGAKDPVEACKYLNDGAECSWHNGTNVQRGKCVTVGDRTYRTSRIKDNSL